MSRRKKDTERKLGVFQGLEKSGVSPTRSHFFSGDKDDEPYIVNIVLRILFQKVLFFWALGIFWTSEKVTHLCGGAAGFGTFFFWIFGLEIWMNILKVGKLRIMS